MKKLHFLPLLLTILLGIVISCEKYDDTGLKNDVENLENRVNALEKWQSTVNNDLSTLRSIVDALNNKDYITSIEEIKDHSGKVIGFKVIFAKNGSKEIYFGNDSGQNDTTPDIGIKIDSDGVYYWTLNGNWILDDSGNKIPAQGKNGNDGNDGEYGITPRLKIEDGYWLVSYDNGATWEKLGEVGSNNTGTGLFKEVIVSDDIVIFVLNDGNRFAVSLDSDLSIKFNGIEELFLAPNSTIDIDYEINSSTGKVDIELIPSSELMAELIPDNDTRLKGKIRVTAVDKLSKQPKVVILVTNGRSMLMRSLEFEQEAQIEISDNTQKQISSDGGELLLEYFSNVSCEVIIPEHAKSWISTTSTKAITKRTVVFNVAKNDGDKRTAVITIKSKQGNIKAEYTITQGGNTSISFGKDNDIMPGAGLLYVDYAPNKKENAVANMVDGNPDTYYSTDKSKFNITWEGEEELIITGVTIDFGQDRNIQAEDVSLHTSTDGLVWNPHQGVGSSFLGNFEWDFGNRYRTKYIRFEVKNTQGEEEVHIHEFRLHAISDSDIRFNTFEELVKWGSSSSYSRSTPMGRHYENKHHTTEADKAWLANAENEPNLLNSASQYTLKEQSVTLYPFGNPVPADVNQHGIGDCSALAVFAEMAYIFPDFIKSIITDNGNGTYTVAMFDPQGKPVNVCLKSTFLSDNNGNIGGSSGKKGEANWATILEKAIMKWNYIYKVNPDISGIGSEHVAPLFTGEGNSFAITPNSFKNPQFKRAVELSLEERMIVIGGFNVAGLWAGTGTTVTAHAYSFMYSNDQTALCSMRNPWGNSPGSDGSEDGVLNIPDNQQVPPTIDLRIIYPGIAKKYAVSKLLPYSPPAY